MFVDPIPYIYLAGGVTVGILLGYVIIDAFLWGWVKQAVEEMRHGR